MSYTLDLMESLMRTSGEVYRHIEHITTTSFGRPVSDEYLAESSTQDISEILRWDAATADVLSRIYPEVGKNFISLHKVRWKQLLKGEKLNSVLEAKDFLSILDQKRHILRMASVNYENSGPRTFMNNDQDIELTETQKQLPFYIKPGVGIYRKGKPTPVLKQGFNRKFIFLEGCIKLCDSDFKVDSRAIHDYLIQNQARFPEHKPNIKDLKGGDLLGYISRSYNDLKDNGKIEGFTQFLSIERGKDCLQWHIS